MSYPAIDDVNDYEMYQQDGVVLNKLDLSDHDGSKFGAILKISHSKNISGAGLKIAQGLKNAVDIDVCENVNLEGEFGLGPVAGFEAIMIKGGSKNISVKGIIYDHGSRQGADVCVGNWMDQSYEMTRNVNLDLTHSDGRKLYYVTGWVVPFTVKTSPNFEWLFWESVKLKAYILAKFAIRCVLGIPRGTRGPTWF